MGAKFTNSGNSKTFDSCWLLLNLTNNINLKKSDKCIVLSSFSIYHTLKNVKMPYKKNKLNWSTPT